MRSCTHESAATSGWVPQSPNARLHFSLRPALLTSSRLTAICECSAAGIAYLLAPVVAWITTLGPGYLPPLGFTLAMLALGNVFAKTGWAEWFPWSIVPLSIGMVGKTVQTLPASSYVVVALTFLAGIVATVLQLRYADNTQ